MMKMMGVPPLSSIRPPYALLPVNQADGDEDDLALAHGHTRPLHAVPADERRTEREDVVTRRGAPDAVHGCVQAQRFADDRVEEGQAVDRRELLRVEGRVAARTRWQRAAAALRAQRRLEVGPLREREQNPGEQSRRRLVAGYQERGDFCARRSATRAERAGGRRTGEHVLVGEPLAHVRGRVRPHEQREEVARAGRRQLLALCCF
jgi:hypothetical protein